MKSIVLYIGLLCLVINAICGLVLSSYSSFNCLLTSDTIIINMVLMYLVAVLALKDAYRISVNVLFPLLFMAEFVCGLFSPEQWKDNWFIIFMAVAVLIEGIILIVTNHISKTLNYE